MRQKEPDVLIEHPHVRQFCCTYMAQQRRDAIQVNFATDKANVRVFRGLGGKVFAAAKPDLKANRGGREGEQPRGIEQPFGLCDPHLRQK